MKTLSSLAADWPVLNRLLDEALALPAEERVRRSLAARDRLSPLFGRGLTKPGVG